MMKKMFHWIAVFSFCMLAGCSSIRMKYGSEVKGSDGRTGTFVYQKSYDVGSYPVLCGLT